MDARSVRALAVEAWRRAEAMGLIEPDARRLEAADVARLVKRLRDAEAEAFLRLVIAALEASPVAKYEWPAVSRVLEPDQLAPLLGISVTSLRRYLSGERETPDEVAARLHHLALIVGDLGGAYNEVGIRRWFGRKRSGLGGRTPAAMLAAEWSPEDPGPQKVRDLARSLVTLSGT
jgi:hypothetical protein